jgi:endonuclease-3
VDNIRYFFYSFFCILNIILQLKDKINNIIRLLKKEVKASAPEPSNTDPLDVLIATMLSQNTTDKTSYRAFINLKENFNGWHDVMTAKISKVADAIRVCGLANQKSRAIQKLLKELYEKTEKLTLKGIKKLDDTQIYEELLQYDGVGIKTISCVLAFGLGRDVFPVDTHVHRVANRLGLVHSKTPDKTFEQLKDKIPKGKKFILHTSLIRFGRKICRAKNPLCSKCILYDLCEFEDKEYYAELTSRAGIEAKENNFIILEHV